MSNVLVRAAAALLPAMMCACAATTPKLQEGLWEVHGQSIENPGNQKIEFIYKLCRDHAYDKALDDRIKDVKGCSTSLQKVGGDKFVAASRCTAGPLVIESKGTTVYPNSTSIHSETQATYTPSLKGKTDQSMIEDQKYLGACPADMKPGDRLMSNGILLHGAR
jgi:hypothetical protein